MRLSPTVLNAHLNYMGQHCAWRKAFSCPCINPNSGAAKPNCPNCLGKGTLWKDAVKGMAGLSGQKVQREWFQFGVAELGDVVLSLPSNSPLYAMSQFDRVILSDSSQPFSLSMTRGRNDVLRFPVVKIDRVFWLVNDAIVEGGIPSVSSGGVLTWASGEPPAGAVYSISGRQRPEYFVYGEFPSDRAHHGGLALPRRVVLRKFDLYGR